MRGESDGLNLAGTTERVDVGVESNLQLIADEAPQGRFESCDTYEEISRHSRVALA